MTITLTKERALGLCETGREILDPGVSRFYYFAPVEHFLLTDPGQVFEEIFYTPRDFREGKRYQLIPPLAK